MREIDQANRRVLIHSAFLMITIVLLAGGMGVYVLSDSDLRNAIRFASTAAEIESAYPRQLDWDEIYARAMNGMLSTLDRYSSFIPPERFAQMNEENSGSYGGIGVTVMTHSDGLLVMSVRECGPAAAAGMLSGDIILSVDSIKLAGLTVGESSNFLRGKENSQVKLLCARPSSSDTLEIALSREKINLLHIPFAGYASDSVIYIRLLDFGAGASKDLKAAIDSLLDKPNTKPNSIVLDFRGNPGGLFSEAYEVADLFLDEGQFIVGTDSRSRWSRKEYYSTGKDRTGNIPIVIMVDRGTASAAEIVAGALSQLDRAVLVGDTTFGKGLVQGFSTLGDGSGLRLTISRYFLPGNLYLNDFDSALNDIGHGIVPDHFYKTADRKEFPRVLENSLLLREFAAEYQDEIIDAGSGFGLSDDWVDRFQRYCGMNGFRYVSKTAKSAKLIFDFARLKGVRPQTYKLVGQIERKARKLDSQSFIKYRSYIKRRLREIAFERKLGMYRTYAEIIVPERDDIQMAIETAKQLSR